MIPATQAEGHGTPGLVDELVPGLAAMVEVVGGGAEDAVREPFIAYERPDVFDWPFDIAQESIELG